MIEWCLERLTVDGSDPFLPIFRLPFSVGREATCDLCTPSAQTSRLHARFDPSGDNTLLLTDLGSANGTFVNRTRLTTPTELADGDIVHFGDSEFRVRRVDAELASHLAENDDTRTCLVTSTHQLLSDHFVKDELKFIGMLKTNAVRSLFQPIVHLRSGSLFAYEMLGRGNLPGLAESPGELFSIAARLKKQVELSEAFRWTGIIDAVELGAAPTLFTNAHPREMFSEALYRSLLQLRAAMPTASLVLEVHETAVTEVKQMREMAARLAAMQIRFAYDDFGAGQARLLELAEVPPHFVKFDMALIRGLDRASPARRQLISQLVKLVHDVRSVALAEGVETIEEAQALIDLGFDLAQGYLLAKPMTAGAASQMNQAFYAGRLRPTTS